MVLALVVAPRRYDAGCGDLNWHSVAHTCSIATFFFVHDRDFKICFNECNHPIHQRRMARIWSSASLLMDGAADGGTYSRFYCIIVLRQIDPKIEDSLI